MNVSKLSFVAAGVTMAAAVFGLLPAGAASAATPKCTTTVEIASSDAGEGFMWVPWSGSTTRCSMVEGNNNSAVLELQWMMHDCYSETALSKDGTFGPATLAALKRTQAKIHAGVDGQYGPETASKIEAHGETGGCGHFPAN